MPTLELPPTSKERPRPSRILIWYSGAFGTEAGARAIFSGLKKNLTDTSVRAVPSKVSKDAAGQNFEIDINSVEDQVRQGGKVTLVSHSSGVIEMINHLRVLERNLTTTGNTELLTKNVDIVLVAPVGFVHSWSELAAMFRGVAEIARSNKSILPIGRLISFRQGIESINYLPPTFTHLKLEEFNQVLTEIFSQHTQRQRGVLSTEFAPGEESYFNQLAREKPAQAERTRAKTQAQQAKDAPALDQLLESNVVEYLTAKRRSQHQKQQRHARAIKSNLQRRGRLLEPEMTAAYAGEETGGGWLSVWWQALQGLLEITKQAARGEPYRALTRYRDMGVRTKFVVPEFDPLVSVEQIRRFAQEGKQDDHPYWLAGVNFPDQHANELNLLNRMTREEWQMIKEMDLQDPFSDMDKEDPDLLDIMLVGTATHSSLAFDAGSLGRAIRQLLHGK